MHHPIYLFRHGETVWNAEKRAQGYLDSPLTETGRAQARAMGRRLARELTQGGYVPAHVVVRASPLALEMIKTLVSEPVQTGMAKAMGNGPVNTKVDVNMAELKMAPVGERAKLVLQPDWDAINAHRDEWTKRWNREVER